jgi:hypothetical protein
MIPADPHKSVALEFSVFAAEAVFSFELIPK